MNQQKQLFVKLTIALSFIFLSIGLNAANNSFKISINGKNYDKLILLPYPQAAKIAGQKISFTDSSSVWVFSVPDSVYCNFLKLLFVPVGGANELNTYQILFTKNIGSVDISQFDDSSHELILTYKESKLKDKSNGGKYIEDYCTIDQKSNPDFEVLCNNLSFGFFYDYSKAKDQQPSYDFFVDNYKRIIQNYPNSKFLLARTAMFKDKFNTIDDYKSVFNQFSPEIKKSYLGKSLQKYIYENQVFVNYKLQNTRNLVKEPIIQDSSAYNLIIFSASWCSPCHKLIPILKELHKDLYPGLQLTYLSVDDKSSQSKWIKLIDNENISWRSLITDQDTKLIKNHFGVVGIPHCILVYPNFKKHENLNLFKEEDVNKLYKLCKSK